MTDGPDSLRHVSRSSSDHSVESLASKALDLLVKRRVAGPRVLCEKNLADLRSAVLAGGSSERRAVLASMRVAGITHEEIFDRYVPDVARQLGQSWCEDSLDFAKVTIGCARLQGLLRELEGEFECVESIRSGSVVALAVLEDNSHTLGATVFASQLRRLGISVRLLMGVTEADALRELHQGRYDAIFLSVSSSERLEKLAKLVDIIRKQTRRNTPIAIGGPVLAVAGDVKVLTGADIATSDINEAVRACRLKAFPTGVPEIKRVS